METKLYTIGELSELSGQSVRKIRFYSDKGLLPPAARSGANYRLYTERDAAALSLISALRQAGAGLSQIRQVLDEKLRLKELLRIRLEILQAEIQIRTRTADVLRELLRLPEPGEHDLRRLHIMNRLNNLQIQNLLEDFIGETTRAAGLTDEWCQRISAGMLPFWPSAPTATQ
ncbi:MerR family transcriptional regulator [Kosakonia cowanii]|uniref:helix-turn-helix domain-containing protein n=1 Tax=Kosakonia cowanii TaxID=208223 RepID=UPI00345C4917